MEDGGTALRGGVQGVWDCTIDTPPWRISVPVYYGIAGLLLADTYWRQHLILQEHRWGRLGETISESSRGVHMVLLGFIKLRDVPSASTRADETMLQEVKRCLRWRLEDSG